MSLPVPHLSASSIRLFLQCPEKWRRRYIEREYEMPSGAMVLGGAVGATLAQSDHLQIQTGRRLALEAELDLYADEWTERTSREEIDYGGESSGALKDDGARLVEAYEGGPGAEIEPIAVERRYTLTTDGVDVVGFTDVEEVGRVRDRKTSKQRYTPAKAASELQPTVYLAMRRAMGEPADFYFDTMVRTRKAYAETVPAHRTDAQLDGFLRRVSLVAEEIEWRTQTGNWQGAAPGSWWCAENTCGYWGTCPYGGMR